MGRVVYINGALVPRDEAKISVFDHGLLYGDGVFEGISVYARQVFRLDAHLRRLYEGARAIRLTVPVSEDEMRRAVADTVAANNHLADGYIRLVVTRGVGTLGLNPDLCKQGQVIIIFDTIALYPDEFYQNGLELVTAREVRICRHKGREVQELHITMDDLLAADECFLTGTAAEVIPVVKVDANTIGEGKPGPVTREILADYRRLTRGQ